MAEGVREGLENFRGKVSGGGPRVLDVILFRDSTLFFCS